MLASIGLLALGIAALYFGAEWFIKGSAGIAAQLGVRPLLIGLTVVALGTSAPELVVSTIAALQGKSEMALGNVIGSNIANIGLILGSTALICPIAVEGALIWRELPALIITALVIPILLLDSAVSRNEAFLLLAGVVLFTVVVARGRGSEARHEISAVEADAEAAGAPAGKGRIKLSLIALAGLGLLLGGGKGFVDGASHIAIVLGMSERTVGLTIVAVGTSLPELAASLIASLRGHGSIAVGNVLGSNIFNVLLVLGGAGAITPISGSVAELAPSLLVLAAMSVLAAIMLRKQRNLTRIEGAFLCVAYAAFLVVIAR